MKKNQQGFAVILVALLLAAAGAGLAYETGNLKLPKIPAQAHAALKDVHPSAAPTAYNE